MLRVPAFSFRGRLEKDERYAYALCEHAGIGAHGRNEEEALERLKGALTWYLEALAERNELEAAIATGKVHLELLGTGELGATRQRVRRRRRQFTAQFAGIG